MPSTVAWLAEEIGELAQAVRKGYVAQQMHEFSDVLAWVATLANQMGIDLSAAVERYAERMPTLRHTPVFVSGVATGDVTVSRRSAVRRSAPC